MENGDDRTQPTVKVAPFYSGALAPNHSGVDSKVDFNGAAPVKSPDGSPFDAKKLGSNNLMS